MIEARGGRVLQLPGDKLEEALGWQEDEEDSVLLLLLRPRSIAAESPHRQFATTAKSRVTGLPLGRKPIRPPAGRVYI